MKISIYVPSASLIHLMDKKLEVEEDIKQRLTEELNKVHNGIIEDPYKDHKEALLKAELKSSEVIRETLILQKEMLKDESVKKAEVTFEI